jgi:hypothetical protein
MRFSTIAAACLCLSAVAGGFAAATSPPPADVPGTAAPGTAAPASAPAGTAVPATNAPAAAKPPATPAPPSSGDAAAKHAKRTACLKDAKTKILVGADKTSFLKSCIAAP